MKGSLRSFFICILVLSLFSFLLIACEQEQVPEAPAQNVVENPFAQASETEILQQYPDDLDDALQELEWVEES